MTILPFAFKWPGVWLTSFSMTALVILLRLTGLLQSWELAIFDQYLRLRPTQARDNRIVIVGIDALDVQSIGQAIIPDGVYAQLLAKLKTMQPRAIGLDVYRDLPVQPGHQQLEEIFKSTDNLIGIQKVIGDRRREGVDPSAILKAKGQVGANDLIADQDNRVRRALLSVPNHKGETIYSFASYLALLYLDAQGISPQIVPKTDNWWQFGETIFAPFEENDGGYLGADDGGYQVLLNYRGSSQHFETVSMRDIFEGRIDSNWGRDRIILIGFVDQSFKDVIVTPYTKNPSQRMAGVEVHANITSQIISAALDNRPLIKVWSEPVKYLWIFFWANVGAMIAWTKRNTTLSFERFGLVIVATIVLLGITYIAFLQSWWIPVIPPLLALVGSVTVITGNIAVTAGKIRNTFGRYLSNEIVAILLESKEGLKLGGERRKITVLTSDLRGFTAISESLPPEEVVKVLNFYLGSMADIITQYQGTIDEFMGDGILVLFGAPILRADDPQRAIACAIDMQLAMDKINQQMKKWNLPPLEMGIGINTGEVVVGNIGSEKRAKYGVVGNQVNLAYRIESYTIGGQILISETTFQEAGAMVKVDGKKQVTPKGVKNLLTIYEVRGIAGQYNLSLPDEEEILLPLLEPIPLRYAIVQGKDVSTQSFKGSLLKLSTKGAEISFNEVEQASFLSPLCNLKINILFKNSTGMNEDIYGKLLETPTYNKNAYIRFTSVHPRLKLILANLYDNLKENNLGK